MTSLFGGNKKPKTRRVYKKVSDKTINIATSSTMPRVQSVNPLFHLIVSRGFALGKRSNNMLGSPLKKSNNMLLLIVFVVVAIIAGGAVYMLTSAPPGDGIGGILQNTPLGPITENFKLPNLSNSK